MRYYRTLTYAKPLARGVKYNFTDRKIWLKSERLISSEVFILRLTRITRTLIYQL